MRLAVATAALSFLCGIVLVVAVARVGSSEAERTRGVLPAASQPQVPPPHEARTAGAESDEVVLVPAAPSGTTEFHLVGENYRWQVYYRESAGVAKRLPRDSDTDSRVIHLPKKSHVRLVLHSHDYVYLVSIEGADARSQPASQIAVPNQVYMLDFETGSEGRLLIRGDHLCGLPQPELNLSATVESEYDFRAWVAAIRN